MTKTRDIGRFDQPVLICGGAYSNLEALEAFFAEADRRGVPPARIIHTGDVVAYGADPDATARLLMARGVHAIPGNVEEQLAAGAADCACGYDEDSVCGTLALTWWDHADRSVGEELRGWMRALPAQLTFSIGAARARVVHGGVNVINRFIYATSGDEVFAEEFAAAGADIVIGGHSGIPFTRIDGARCWHNSGALGLPANDGTPRVWFSMLSPQADGGVVIEHRALGYDHEAAHAKMTARGLPAEYAKALITGLLPEGNALPPEEQASAGKTLRFPPFCWRPARRDAAE